MDFSSFERYELTALVRALSFVRFESNELGASQLAGSPILHSLFEQASKSLWEKTAAETKASTAIFFLTNGWPRIEEQPEAVKAIKAHILNAENWIDLSDTDKLDFIKILIQPFKYDESFIYLLKEYGDSMSLKTGL